MTPVILYLLRISLYFDHNMTKRNGDGINLSTIVFVNKVFCQLFSLIFGKIFFVKT